MGRKYAIINNNKVTDILILEENDVIEYSKTNQLVIDVEEMSPCPSINYVLNGNVLEIPSGNSDKEEYEYQLAVRKTDFGIKLARFSVDKVGARNKILNKSGQQVAALLNQLLTIKLLLETGALGTARYSCIQLKSSYTEYEDIFDNIINQINSFELSNGL